MELIDDPECLAARAAVGVDRLQQITGPAVMKKENPLPGTPERSCPKLIWARATLRNAVRQAPAHVVDKEIGKQIHYLVG